MNPSDPLPLALDDPRWRRLDALPLDEENAAFSFSRRLARDNGWTNAYARRVVNEYKRFAFLAVAAGHEVTPSDEVDQAWHLHLTYTRHYWGAFTEALGAQLHHNPTAGGPREKQRYEDNYAATFSSYEKFFGKAPPADIWPSAKLRFGDAPFMQRVNRRRYFIVARNKALPVIGAASGAAVLSASVAAQDTVERMSALMQFANDNPVIAYGTLMVIILLSLMAIRSISAGGQRKERASKNGRGGYADGGGSGGKSGGKGDGDGGDGASGCSGCGGCGG